MTNDASLQPSEKQPSSSSPQRTFAPTGALTAAATSASAASASSGACRQPPRYRDFEPNSIAGYAAPRGSIAIAATSRAGSIASLAGTRTSIDSTASPAASRSATALQHRGQLGVPSRLSPPRPGSRKAAGARPARVARATRRCAMRAGRNARQATHRHSHDCGDVRRATRASAVRRRKERRVVDQVREERAARARSGGRHHPLYGRRAPLPVRERAADVRVLQAGHGGSNPMTPP